MIKTLLARGLGVGLAAALLAFAFSFLVGEPQVGRAIDLEGQAAAAGVAGARSSAARSSAPSSLATAVGMYGLAVGGLFGIAFAVAYGRIGGFGPRAAAGLLALGGFVTVQLVPFLKYPPNPRRSATRTPSAAEPSSTC